MATVGYVRVSTHDQNLDLQLQAMKEAHADKVFEDKGLSGAQADRPGLTAALEYCREGDTLLIWRLDRLGRKLSNVLAIVETLNERKVTLRSLSEGLTTQGSMGTLMMQILGAFAEFERNVMLERTQAGLAAAHARGSKGGRRPLLTPQQVAEAKDRRAVLSVPELAKLYGVSEPTMYRYISQEA